VRLWALAFALTQVIETPLYTWGLIRAGRPRGAALLLGFGASCLTHPIVWFWLPALSLPAPRYIALAELFAFVAETVYLRAAGLTRAPLWAAVGNFASFAAGACLWGLPR
jgi:hypothetical protein